VLSTATEAKSETSDLMAELRRYLVAVEAFRAEGSEPVWRREEHGVEDEAGLCSPG
jgi:hypothetical protein